MKIAVFKPKSEFSRPLQKKLASLGEVTYTRSRDEYSVVNLIKFAKKAELLAVDPDNLGGFEKASTRLTRIMESIPQLKGISLSTTSYGWIDMEYCRKSGIPVSNIPGYSRESVAEHALAMLLCLAKRIIEVDRETQQGRYQLMMGTELAGKTLGIIGLGNIGSRMAELGQAIGMKVIAYNRAPKKQSGVTMKSFDEVIQKADAISLHVRDTEDLQYMIDAKVIKRMKPQALIVNTASRELVDETALAKGLKSGKVGGYAYEGEDLVHTPLAHIPRAIGLKGFGWYTKEALTNLSQIWVENIVALANRKPRNVIHF